MDHMNNLTGKWFIYKDNIVELNPTFVYELTIYKYWKNGVSIEGSKLYLSDKLLRVKNRLVTKKYDDYTIEQDIALIGVPIEFIKENKLKQFLKVKKNAVRRK